MQASNFKYILKQTDINLSAGAIKNAYILQYLSNKSMDELNEDEKHTSLDKKKLIKQMRISYGTLMNRHVKLKKLHNTEDPDND